MSASKKHKMEVPPCYVCALPVEGHWQVDTTHHPRRYFHIEKCWKFYTSAPDSDDSDSDDIPITQRFQKPTAVEEKKSRLTFDGTSTLWAGDVHEGDEVRINISKPDGFPWNMFGDPMFPKASVFNEDELWGTIVSIVSGMEGKIIAHLTIKITRPPYKTNPAQLISTASVPKVLEVNEPVRIGIKDIKELGLAIPVKASIQKRV